MRTMNFVINVRELHRNIEKGTKSSKLKKKDLKEYQVEKFNEMKNI